MPSGEMNEVVDRLRGVALRDNGAPTDGQLLEAFVVRGDGAAFEALVRRHAPMVLGVCRRVAGDGHDADDAFQAAFLVLVRKAGAVVPRDLVGNWLYGVAYRTALKARALAGRRRLRERSMTDMPRPQPAAEDRAELLALLDRELERLPAKYRVPIILCDLEGRTRRDAAHQLGLPTGTLSGRLTSARRLLAKRLARHGLAVSGTALGVALEAQAAVVSNDVVSATIKSAALFAAGSAAAAGMVPGEAAALAEGVIKSMLLTKLKLTTAVLVAAAAIGAGVLAYESPAPGPEQPPRGAPPAQSWKSSRAEEEKLKRDVEEARVVLAQAQGREAAAQAELELAKLQLERAEALYQRSRTAPPKEPEKPRPDPRPTPLLKARGHLHPESVVQVTPSVTGKVTEVHVREGDSVKAGQVLAILDGAGFRTDVERAQVSVDLAKARLQEAKALKSVPGTFDGPAAARIAVAEGELRRAELELAHAKSQLEKTALRAPIAGTVTKRQVEVGDSVGPDHGQLRGARLFELIDPRVLLAAVPVMQEDIGKVFPGQHVRIVAMAAPGTTLEGKVTRIAPTVDTATASIMVHIMLRPPANDSGWRPGMSVIAEFQPKE